MPLSFGPRWWDGARATTARDAATSPGEDPARLDPVTQVLTPLGLAHVLDIQFKHAGRTGILPTAILLSCDENECLGTRQGQPVADAVRSETARRIRSVLRTSDAVGRVGTDAFLVVLAETGYWEALRVAERLRGRVTAPVPLPTGESVSPVPTLAVASIPEATISVDDIVTLAQRVLARNRAREVSTDPGRGDTVVELLSNAQTFRVIREPIVHLGTGRVTGYELLSRTGIEHFELPADFLRVALVSETLTRTDLLCLETCITALQRWGDTGVDYHINVFPSTILDTPPERILRVVTELPDLRRLCIEITEQQFFGDRTRLRAHLDVLRAAGVRIALDDVGFGRTALELLILIAPDVVKIDRAFVKGVSTDATRTAEFRRLVEVIRALGATAIAEGIETAEDAKAIQALGVEFGQGFLWPAVV